MDSASCQASICRLQQQIKVGQAAACLHRAALPALRICSPSRHGKKKKRETRAMAAAFSFQI
jgi:hypothetical protein